ncbi:MAG: Asp-tRNA(Asn)/Glu-tRNA(Gln) amidotransferase subunit GatA [Nitrospiraceae bacterium]|nr:MAG: Asp-tRNA(Asn)/Glu-tRNA(Gln) amidotransferase subunit GatA [Nitrospiraceae bacterium]
MDLFELGISELRALLEKREISSVNIVESICKRIDRVENNIKAYITVTKEHALHMAEHADKEMKNDITKPLLGIPVAVKDNICTKDILTTCASKILSNYIPPYESTVTARMLKDGYILIGKANLDEFAMGSSTEHSSFFATRNPWNTDRIPGGSSGGAAAAVAANECIAALGSDTGGSIRLPAALCGVVGMKPTYGRVSRYGLVAFASSLDQIGPITKNVNDAAILLNSIAGKDTMDATSAPMDVPDFTAVIGEDIKGIKVGIPKEYFIKGMDPEITVAVQQAIKQLETLGAVPVDVSLPHTEYAIAAYYVLALSEASSNLARYDGVKYGFRAEAEELMDMYLKSRSEGFGQEVKRRIMIGTYALSSGYYDAYYKKAQQVRTLIKDDFENVFKTVDIIATPTAPTPAFRLGEKIADPLQMYLTDIFTLSVNLAGVPGISVPCGFTSDKLPIGLQLIGRHFDEETILKVAHAFEQSTEWHRRNPNL